MSGIQVNQAGQASSGQPFGSGFDAVKSREAVYQTLFEITMHEPHNAEQAFQSTFDKFEPEQQQQLAGEFVDWLGGGGMDRMTETVEGQHALLSVYDHADCLTKSKMHHIHKRMLVNGNFAVDFTRSDNHSDKTKCIDSIEKSKNDIAFVDAGKDGHAGNENSSNTEPANSTSSKGDFNLSKQKIYNIIEGIEKKEASREGGIGAFYNNPTLSYTKGGAVTPDGKGIVNGGEARFASYTNVAFKAGEPCNVGEVGIGTSSIKAFKGIVGFFGPEVGADLMCIDPNTFMEKTSADIVKKGLETDVFKKATNDVDGQRRKNQLEEAAGFTSE
jgi:transcription termination factor NusB